MKTFTHTSDALYTRHRYKLHQINASPIICDDYMSLRDLWMHRHGVGLSHIEVLDIETKRKPKGGFK